MFCSHCGKQIKNEARFCPYCGGTQSDNNDAKSHFTGDNSREALNSLLKKMRMSSTIWLVIGIYQIVTGLFTLVFGYGIAVLILGIWNLAQSSNRRKSAKAYSQKPVGILNAYESNQTLAVIMIFVNLFLGAVLGVIGAIYDYSVSAYVMQHRDDFHALEVASR